MLQFIHIFNAKRSAGEDIVPTRYASLETGQMREYRSSIRAGLCAEYYKCTLIALKEILHLFQVEKASDARLVILRTSTLWTEKHEDPQKPYFNTTMLSTPFHAPSFGERTRKKIKEWGTWVPHRDQ